MRYGPQQEGKHYGGKTLLTDEQVREARVLHERKGWTSKQIREHFAVLGITLSVDYTKQLLDYTIRSRILID